MKTRGVKRKNDDEESVTKGDKNCYIKGKSTKKQLRKIVKSKNNEDTKVISFI